MQTFAPMSKTTMNGSANIIKFRLKKLGQLKISYSEFSEFTKASLTNSMARESCFEFSKPRRKLVTSFDSSASQNASGLTFRIQKLPSRYLWTKYTGRRLSRPCLTMRFCLRTTTSKSCIFSEKHSSKMKSTS